MRSLARVGSRVRAFGLLTLALLGLGGPVLSVALAQAPAGTGPRTAEERALALKRVSSQLICQCSCNMVLAECSHQSCPFALPERKAILAALDAGQDEDDIVAGYVKEYGRGILSSPPTEGSWLDRLAWVLPWAALLAGAVVTARLVLVFVRRGREQAMAPPLSDEDRKRIEDEIARAEGRGART